MSAQPTRSARAALLVTVIATLSPWPFASVEPFFYGLVAALVLGVACAALLASAAGGATGGPRPPRGGRFVACALAVPFVALLQAVPLPRALVSVLSPRTVETLRLAVPPDVPDWLPLSLDVHSTLDSATLAAAFVAVVLLVGFGAARGAGRAIAWTFVVGGALLAVFGLLQRLIQPDPTMMFWSVKLNETGTPFGSYVNRNHFGGAMLVFTGVSLGLADAARLRGRTREMRVAVLVGLLLVVSLLACTSRGALVGLGVVAVGLLVTAAPRARKRIGAGIAVVGGVGLVALTALGLFGDLAARAALQPRWMSRFLVQADALDTFLSFPLTGTGAGTFESVYPAFQTIADDRHFSSAHSDWAQFLMETGLLGAAAGLALAWVVVARVRAGAGGGGAPAGRTPSAALANGASLGLAGLAAHGFFETNLHIPANAFLAGVAAGLAWGAATRALAPARAAAAVSSPPGLAVDEQGEPPSV